MTLDEIITGVLAREGGAVADPVDRGGPTNRGITLGSYRELYPGASVEDLMALDEDGARRWYRLYLAPLAGVQAPDRIWAALLDAAVLHGRTGAVRLLQQALGVPADGRLGPVTQTALTRVSETVFASRFARARLDLVVDLVRHDLTRRYGVAAVDETQVRFLRGWLRRIVDVAFG